MNAIREHGQPLATGLNAQIETLPVGVCYNLQRLHVVRRRADHVSCALLQATCHLVLRLAEINEAGRPRLIIVLR